MSRLWLISGGQWEVLEGLLPPRRPVRGGPRCGHRRVLGGIVYQQFGGGVAWSARVLWAVADGVGTPPRLGAGRRAGRRPPCP